MGLSHEPKWHSACWPGRSSRSGHAREEEPTPLTTKLEQMLTQLGSFPGASAAWFQLTVTLTHAFGLGEQKCPRLLAGGWSRVSAKGEFRRVDNASGGIGFPERAGSAPLMRISPRTARQKCGRRRWLPWCISRSRTSKPRYGSVRLPPFLCFDCEPRPGACHIKENISHSRTRCRLCPL